METISISHSDSLTDMYMSVLSTLSADDRLELITKLSNSIRKERQQIEVPTDLRTCFKADWSSVEASDLRDRDHFGRNIENW